VPLVVSLFRSLISRGLSCFSSEFSVIDRPDITVIDVTGRVVYRVQYEATEHAILWVWRELLLSSIVHCKDESLAKTLVADIEKMELAREMLARLVDEISRCVPSTLLATGGRLLIIVVEQLLHSSWIQRTAMLLKKQVHTTQQEKGGISF
jgi:hypothetical protein